MSPKRTGFVVLVVGLLAVVCAGCLGGDDDSGETATGQTSRDAPASEGRGDPAKVGGGADERRGYCQSAVGERLRALGQDSLEAVGRGDGERLGELTDRALKDTAVAPGGASCAVLALDTLARSWKVGGSTLEGVDAKAERKRVVDFQRAHGLEEPVY